MIAAAESCVPEDPRSYNEARHQTDHKKWRKAMEDKVRAMKREAVWTLTDIIDRNKFILTRCIYQVKKKYNGFIERYRARLVAKVFSKKPSTNFRGSTQR